MNGIVTARCAQVLRTALFTLLLTNCLGSNGEPLPPPLDAGLSLVVHAPYLVADLKSAPGAVVDAEVDGSTHAALEAVDQLGASRPHAAEGHGRVHCDARRAPTFLT